MKRLAVVTRLLAVCCALFMMQPLCGVGVCYAKSGFLQKTSNRKLSQLVEMMSGVNLPLKDTIMKCRLLPPNKSLVVRYNGKQQIVHLGVSLFSQETKVMLDKSVCDFLERFFLELVLQETHEDVKRKLIEYHVRLQYNGGDFGTGWFFSIYKMLENLTMPVGFNLRYEKKYGLASWVLKDDIKLTMKFPMSAELINGMDKKEADTELYDRLVQLKASKDAFHDDLVRVNELLPYTADVYVKKGAYFLIPSLNSDVYYLKTGWKFLPLFSSKMPEKSLQTLFQTYGNGKDVFLLLTHRQYGHFTPEIVLPLNNFLAMFEHDFDIFTGTKRRKNGEIETLVVIHHRTLNYIHLLRVRNRESDIERRPLQMKADFYSNIPQHYIKSLFNINPK